MPALKDIIDQPAGRAPDPLDLEELTEIVDAELDNVAGGGSYCQYISTHSRSVEGNANA